MGRRIWTAAAATVFVLSAMVPVASWDSGQARAKGLVYAAVVAVFALGATMPFPRLRLFCIAAALVPGAWLMGSMALFVYYLALVLAGVTWLGLELKSFSRIAYVVAGVVVGVVLRFTLFSLLAS